MKVIRKIPGKLAAVLALAIYLGIALPVATYFMDRASAVEIAAAIFIPLPIVAFVAGWIWIEMRIGKRLMPRLQPDRSLETKTSAKAERRAMILGLPLVVFIAGAPVLTSALSDRTFHMTDLAAPFAWVWIIYVFGFERLKLGLITLMTGAKSASFDTEEVRQVLLGLALEQSRDCVAEWDIRAFSGVEEGMPRPHVDAIAHIPPPPKDPDGDILCERRDLLREHHDILALITASTGNGNAHRLRFAGETRLQVVLSDLSSHEKVSALQSLKAARARAEEIMLKA